MRQKRAKAYKKQMATYERDFGFRHPYQVLYSADFLVAARSFQLDAVAGIKRTVQNEVKNMITQCCIKELYDAKADPSIRLAKSMERRRCGHVDAPETPTSCILECVGTRNKNRYIVATQDQKLREKLRRVPGVPLVYINRSVMILEPPSPATLMIKEIREKAKLGLSQEEAEILGKRKRPASKEVSADATSDNDSSEDESAEKARGQGTEQRPRKTRKGPPGPNPLSAKKPKSSLKNPLSSAMKVGSSSLPVRIILGASTEPENNRSRRKRRHTKGKSVDAAASAPNAPEEISIAR